MISRTQKVLEEVDGEITDMANEAVRAIRHSAFGIDLLIQHIRSTFVSPQNLRLYVYYLMGYNRSPDEHDWGKMERKLGAMILAHLEILNMMAGERAVGVEPLIRRYADHLEEVLSRGV